MRWQTCWPVSRPSVYRCRVWGIGRERSQDWTRADMGRFDLVGGRGRIGGK
uniref:Uncharacterized protein n=1 Tax=Anguilla anguilla TaxID=7936 RepID=A0A0E9W506_ANGAN